MTIENSGSGSKSLPREVGLAAVATGLTALMWIAGWTAPLDRSAGDALLRLTNRTRTGAAVMAVVIDDVSVATRGPLPWPRSLVAELVAGGHRAGAAAVALDLLLVEAGHDPGDLDLESALGEGRSLLAAAIGRDGGWLLPNPRFGGSERAAHVHAEVGPDGVARTIVATKQAHGLSLPALSLAAARLIRPEIELQPGEVLRPDFRPAPVEVLRVSATDFLSSRRHDHLAAGRLVFIGVTATGSGDRLIVPTDAGPAPSPGVLVHASAAASILGDRLVRSPGSGWTVFGLFLAALAPQVLRTRNGAFRPLTVAAIIIAIAAAAVAALELRHVLLPAPILVVGIIVSIVLREGVESRDAQRESGRLLESLLRHHDRPRPSGVPKSSAARLTALRDLQTAVLQQDAARRTLLDGMHDGVVMWDSDGQTAVVNPAAVRLWGAEPGRADFADLEAAGGGDRAAVFARHGREIAVEVFSIGDRGMALLRDVTAERELERKRRDMQRLVSHELKTPLASIAGFGETLQRYELTADEQHRVASLIRGESLRLGEMVATFLDLERLGSGQFTDSTETLDLGALVSQRLEILAQAARARRQSIAPKIEADVTVRAAATLLARVVDNLVGNAIKYSPEGGEVEVSVSRTDGRAILAVTDHGAGIPLDAQPRLFERFYRVPGTRGAGSGLGLAVAHEIATWHGGCIGVESVVGQGSTFTVRLPAEE
jgi:signal transduction histidine kinase/CHASE2 domain-containing sensor protein